ncbi:MAG: hypothetical protein AB9866_29965 [Syntrophobacteraceae bacterium]
MVWRPFATMLEKVDTLEVAGLNNYAPPLYSAVKNKLSAQQNIFLVAATL